MNIKFISQNCMIFAGDFYCSHWHPKKQIRYEYIRK